MSTTSSIKINLPDLGVKLSDLTYIYFRIKGATFGLFVIIWSFVLRAQITVLAKPSLDKAEGIQALESQRYTASVLLTRFQPAQFAFAGLAIAQSAFVDAAEYQALSEGERETYLFNYANDRLLSQEDGTPRPAKVLSERQINSETSGAVHRRGIMARLRGKFQATSIFSAGEVIRGMSVAVITFDELIVAIFDLFENISLKEVLLEEMKDFIIVHEGSLSSKFTEVGLAMQALQIAFQGKEDVTFDDAVRMAPGEQAENLTPLEKSTELRISRSLPSESSAANIDPNQDPYLKLAASQMSGKRRGGQPRSSKPGAKSDPVKPAGKPADSNPRRKKDK